MNRRHPLQHLHACVECGRPFYLCCERDCALAPEVCQACEMDRMDAAMSQPTFLLPAPAQAAHFKVS
jgi:hypothetical protein